MSQTGTQVDYSGESQNYFRENSKDMERPTIDRKCQDIFFLVVLFLLLAAFIGYGSYAINQIYTRGIFSLSFSRPTSFILYSLTLQNTKVALSYIIAMMGLSLLIATLSLILLRYYTYCAYIYIISGAFTGLIALTIISFIYNMLSLGAILCVTTLITFIVWCCFRKQLLSVVVILKSVSILLAARPLVFLITSASLLYGILLAVFWLAGYWSICLFYSVDVVSEGEFIGLTVFWVFCMFYFLFICFYTMVFLVGGETALWFYKSSQPSITAPFKWLVLSQLGSVSLAAFLLAIIKVIQLLVTMARSSRRNVKGIVGVVLMIVGCLLSCVMRRFEYYTKIINSYAMIICSVTGRSYISSALTFGCLMYSNLNAYCTFSMISYFIRIGGTLTCVFIPSIISYYLFESIPLETSLVHVGVGIVIFFSFLVSIVVLETLVVCMDSMFVFYSMEAQMGEFGQTVQEINEEQEKLEAIYSEGLEDEYMKIKRKQERVPVEVIEIVQGNNRVVVADGQLMTQQQTLNPVMPPTRLPAPTFGKLLKNIVNEGNQGSQTALGEPQKSQKDLAKR